MQKKKNINEISSHKYNWLIRSDNNQPLARSLFYHFPRSLQQFSTVPYPSQCACAISVTPSKRHTTKQHGSVIIIIIILIVPGRIFSRGPFCRFPSSRFNVGNVLFFYLFIILSTVPLPISFFIYVSPCAPPSSGVFSPHRKVSTSSFFRSRPSMQALLSSSH